MNDMLKRALSHRTVEQQMLDELRGIHEELKAQTTALAALVINTQKPQPNETAAFSEAEVRRYNMAQQQKQKPKK